MKLRITSIPNLIAFLKKLKAVDKSVILEITNDMVFSKVHTPDKSVMKYSSVKLGDVFEGKIDWKSLKSDRVKIGIIDATRLMDAFKHFRPEEEVFLELVTDHVDDSCVATEVKLVSASLNIKLRCADLNLLSYVEDNILSIVHSKEDYIVNFKIYQSDFTTILSLCGLENNSEEILCFEISDKNAHAIGESFNYKLNIGSSEILFNDDSTNNAAPNVYKNQLSNMEPETCQVYVHENRFVLFSEQSSTSIAIGLVEK
jgi:hypothetical protein